MITRMDGDPTERTTPDLFPTVMVRDASAPTNLPSAEATTDTAPPRHILPKDLPNALKHLSDGELGFLRAATFEEMKRRGRTPGVETDLQSLRHRFDVRLNSMKVQSPPTKKRRHVDVAEVPSTQGKLNAVRAAFKAGVTPSRIARQFGISQSDVRKALAMNEKERWFVVIGKSLNQLFRVFFCPDKTNLIKPLSAFNGHFGVLKTLIIDPCSKSVSPFAICGRHVAMTLTYFELL
jgi:hypothetical protein